MMAESKAPTSFQFTEKMRGFVTFDETNFEDGYRRGKENDTKLMFQLTIRTEDVDRFVDNAEHEADASGYVKCEQLGGQRAVEKGIFNLFVDSDDQNKRKMLYRLYFRDGGGNQPPASEANEIKTQ